MEEKELKFILNKKEEILKKPLSIKENEDISLPQANKIEKNISKYEIDSQIFEKKYKNFNDKSGKIKILIVDDHKIIRKTLKYLCEKIFIKHSQKDYEILEAKDGVDILYNLIYDQSKNNLIKCVITDENMEYMNGSDAIKIIRKLEIFNKINYTPIATITAFEDNSIKDNIIKKGSDYILSKPCNENQLKEFLEKFMII